MTDDLIEEEKASVVDERGWRIPVHIAVTNLYGTIVGGEVWSGEGVCGRFVGKVF